MIFLAQSDRFFCAMRRLLSNNISRTTIIIRKGDDFSGPRLINRQRMRMEPGSGEGFQHFFLEKEIETDMILYQVPKKEEGKGRGWGR